MVMVLNYGEKDGIHSFNVTGSIEDLHKIIDSVHDSGGEFSEDPIFKHVHRGQYILYLKLKVGLVGVGTNEQCNRNAITVENDG
jgi:hypothetical protein